MGRRHYLFLFLMICAGCARPAPAASLPTLGHPGKTNSHRLVRPLRRIPDCRPRISWPAQES